MNHEDDHTQPRSHGENTWGQTKAAEIITPFNGRISPRDQSMYTQGTQIGFEGQPAKPVKFL